MRTRSRVIAHTVCLMVLVQFVMVGILRAQQTGPTGPPSIKDPKSETRDRQDREATLRSAELGVAVGKIDQNIERPAAEGQHRTVAPEHPLANGKFERAEP